MGHVFARVTSAGAASGAPTGKMQRHGKLQISNLKFQIGETAKSNANADPSPLKRVRDDN
jgi:hypothetical protein